MIAPTQLDPASGEPLYACDDCGKLRTRAEGGTVFTVCDACWDRRHPPRTAREGAAYEGSRG